MYLFVSNKHSGLLKANIKERSWLNLVTIPVFYKWTEKNH